MVHKFNTKEEAMVSDVYKTKDFCRFIYNGLTEKYEIEVTDYGTHLSHHTLIEVGNRFDEIFNF